MTDLYGVGKGEAQVLNFNTAENALQLQANQREADRVAKEEAKTKKQDDLLKAVASVGAGKIKPGDLDLFKRETADLQLNAWGGKKIKGKLQVI